MMSGSVVFLATAWGPKLGGVNSFNRDLCAATAAAFKDRFRVICIVPDADTVDVQEASSLDVELLVSTLPPTDPDWADAERDAQRIIEVLGEVLGDRRPSICLWVGHDIFTGHIAVRAAALAGGRSAVLHHIDYRAVSAIKPASDSLKADKKIALQREIFRDAHAVCAVGPKLRRSAQRLTRQRREIALVIPGVVREADMAGLESPAASVTLDAFSGIVFGRLDPDDEPIKQSRLAAAGFAKAQAMDAASFVPDQPMLFMLGLSEDPAERAEQEREIRMLARRYYRPSFGLHGLPYISDRAKVLERVSEQNVCLVISVHDGFALTAWEAVSLGVPLVVSKKTGAYEYLAKISKPLPSGIRAVDIEGSADVGNPLSMDVHRVAMAVLEIARERENALTSMSDLADYLKRTCTWKDAACAVIGAAFPQDASIPKPLLFVERVQEAATPVRWARLADLRDRIWQFLGHHS